MFKKRRKAEIGSIPTTPPANRFKRNLTISGYRHVFGDQTEGARVKVHHLTIQRRKIGAIFIVVLVVLALLATLVWQLIASVNLSTSSRPISAPFSPEIYQKEINNYFGLNPAQRLQFLLDKTSLNTYITSKLPEVESVNLSGIQAVGQADFSIKFRQPVAGWQIGSKQYYVDATGVVFEKNYYSAPSVQIVDENGASVEQGTVAASGRLLGFLGRAVSEAGDRGYSVTKAVLPAGTTRQIDVSLSGIDTIVKFSIDRGAGEQVEDMARTLKFLKSRGINASYIDVRISGRAAYK